MDASYTSVPTTDESAKPVVIGDLLVDVERRLVKKGKEVRHLESLDFQVLACLILSLQTNPGEFVSKHTLLDRVYGAENPPDIGVVKVRICHLRKILDPAPDGESYIENVWGKGYYLRALPVPDSSTPA